MCESPRILIVEVEPKLSRLAEDYLYAVLLNGAGTRGDEAEARFQEAAFNLVVLDLMLPGLMGLPVQIAACPIDRSDHYGDGPGRGSGSALGLEVGADDYLCKPFSPRSWWLG